MVNAWNDSAIGPFENGIKINVDDHINVRANAVANVSSVVFRGEGAEWSHTENFPPFLVGGDTDGNYFVWRPQVGSHVLFVTPYSGPQGTGTAGRSIIVSYTVTGDRDEDGDGD